MRSSVLRVSLAAVLAFSVGCGVSDADIDHWKRTQRGPGKITAVLVGARYERPLRVHAARALIEMKHPNANGLDLLVQAMSAMPTEDREQIIQALLPSLQSQMRGADQQQSAAGPSEPMIRAKDAAYLLLRFANAQERQELSHELMSWLLTDLNTRALAGQYTGEQIVTAVGPGAAEALTDKFTSNDGDLRVATNIASLINGVATDAGKDAAVARLVTVARDIAGPGSTERLHATAEQMLQRSRQTPGPVPADQLNRATDILRKTYLDLLVESIRTLARPAGTQFLISLAADPTTPIERRKSVLAAVANQVSSSDAPALLSIANGTGPQSDLELRGEAIDRLGETRNNAVLPQLWTLFDTTNGGEANQEFTLRWKAGEAILKLGGPGIIPQFIQHLQAPRRPAPNTPPFEGYTYVEINGYALSIGDFTPPPRDAMRALLTDANPHVRALGLLYLGAKGEASDLPRIEAMTSDATPMPGPGWAQQAATLGAVAAKARDALRHSLGQPAAPSAPAAAPAAAPATAPAAPAR